MDASKSLFALAITGSAPLYGPGGYEIKLGDEPLASSGTAWLRVTDLDGNHLSNEVYFSTYDNCGQNLILLNFAQARAPLTAGAYLPVIFAERPNK